MSAQPIAPRHPVTRRKSPVSLEMLRTLGAALALFFWFCFAAAAGATLWYEPSNGNEAGGRLPDFTLLFEPEGMESWVNARMETSVLMLRINTLRNAEEDHPGFIRSRLAPFLSRTGLKLGLNTAVPNFATCEARQKDAARRIPRELDLMRKIKSAGIEISFIKLQSTLSKLNPRCPSHGLEDRIREIVSYIANVRSGLGGDRSLQIGLGDASLAKGEEWVQKNLGVSRLEDAYARLLEALAKQQLSLDFVHLDHPWEAFRDFNPNGRSALLRVRDFQTWLEEHGVASGFILTSLRSTTEAEFHGRIFQMLDGLKRVGAPNRHFILASWKRIPKSELPENPREPERYPMTRVLNEAGRYIDGPGRGAPVASPPRTLQ